MTNLETKIGNEITSSMKSRNSLRTQALRAIKAQFDILNTSGQNDNETAQLKALQKMVKQRKDSADIYLANERQDLYNTEIAEMSVIEEFLPKQLCADELNTIITDIIIENNATSIKDLGKIMGIANKKLAGLADGKEIANIVKSKLA